MNERQTDVAVLTFQMGDETATVVTDGKQVRAYTQRACTAHRSLTRAVAYMEARGYKIRPDMW